MVPALTDGGQSFKGAALYYLHDKRQEGERERLTTDRIAWTETRNLPTDDPDRAWRMMAHTAMAQADLKAAAGTKATGRKLTKPVFAYSLAWHPDERPSQAEQMEAAAQTLERLGLAEHQAIIVCHRDTAHAHVHVLVNRVNPQTGKAATLSKSKLVLSEWAEGYERERGKILCPARAQNNAKRQEQRQERQPEGTAQADFNPAAEGRAKPAQRQERPGRDERTRTDERTPRRSRAEWQAAQTSRQGRLAAQAIRAELADKFRAMEAGRRASYQTRNAEYQAFWDDRKLMRQAIHTKYQEALDKVWKTDPHAKREAQQPDRTALFAKTAQRMEQRQQNFDANERSLLGRLRNVTGLLRPEQRKSFGAFVKLALSREDRRREFDRQQRVIRQTSLPDRPKPGQKGPQPAILSRRNMSDRLKAIRAVELQQFDQETTKGAAAMKQRHGTQIEGEQAQKEAMTQQAAERWNQHNQVYGRTQSEEGRSYDRTHATEQGNRGRDDRTQGDDRGPGFSP